MALDMEMAAELEEFFNDDLLRVFAEDQGLAVAWRIEPFANGHQCTITVDGTDMPTATAHDEQTALDNASVQTIELLTRSEREREPMLAFA